MERTYTAGGPHSAARTAVIWEVLSREIDRASAELPSAGQQGTGHQGTGQQGTGEQGTGEQGTGEQGAGLRVVDAGGGTGGFAVPLAQAGHRVTVVDASPDALAALKRRAEEAGVADRITALQGDADALADRIPTGSADLVLCHSVLEVVDSPADVARALAWVLRPGGAASVLVANRAAAVLGRAMSGHLDLAMQLLRDQDGHYGVRDTLRRRFDADSAATLLTKAGLAVEEVHGVRVVADLVPAAVLERDHEALAAFERATAERSPYRDVATQLHLLARRP